MKQDIGYAYLIALCCALSVVFVTTYAGNAMAEEWQDPGTGMTFVKIPAGTFIMGCDVWMSDCEEDEKPAHKVILKEFWISKFEVTQEQWMLEMGYNPSRFQLGGKHPVEMISWYDAKKYIQKLNKNSSKHFRLPTEAEWEFAARSGGRHEKFSGGNAPDPVAWYLNNSKVGTNPVGQKSPNGFGIYDMTGNVWEWVEDSIGPYPSQAQNNPLVNDETQKRVFRGGSWSYSETEIRTTTRGEYFPDGRSSNLGFRLALDFNQP